MQRIVDDLIYLLKVNFKNVDLCKSVNCCESYFYKTEIHVILIICEFAKENFITIRFK